MHIPFDILDHIFGFLITHPASLAACSEAHPVIPQMVEKYQYHRLIIDPESTRGRLTKLLSDKPQIANYVRVLRIEGDPGNPLLSTTDPFFGRIAAILPLFPVLECIVLSYGGSRSWVKDLPPVLRAAMEDCLRLPTMRELHVDRYIIDFPVSMLNNHPNIDRFSLCGTSKVSEVANTIHPQLKSLSVTGFFEQNDHISFGPWAKPRIATLQSLKYDYSCDHTLLEFLEICSDTLTSLDITLDEVHSPYAATGFFDSSRTRINPTTPLSINLPSHLQNLTIRALIQFFCDENDPYELYESFLPAAISILKTAAPSLHRITLEINVNNNCDGPVFDDVDLSPLTAFADTLGPFRRIDLHFNFDWDFTRTELISRLVNERGLAELMEQGVLVVHLNEVAPIHSSISGSFDF